MTFRDLPIKSKVIVVILVTSLTVMVLMAAALVAYDSLTYRRTIVSNLSTIAAIISDNSTAALAYNDPDAAQQILGALRADPHIVAAALYDERGELFVRYPPEAPDDALPARPEPAGNHFAGGYLHFFKPVAEGGRQYGALYLKSDLGALYSRLRLYGELAALVLLASALVALGISGKLQRRITDPILALAATARIVSERNDYSVRAAKASKDELGDLTDAFNGMLSHIQEQTVELQESRERLHLALEASRTGTWDWNIETNRLAWDSFTHRLFGLKLGEFNGAFDGFLLLVHPEDRAGVSYDVTRALEQRTELNAEFRVVWPDGSAHYLASRGQALYNERGQPVRMTGVTLDISERKQGEEVRSFLVAIVESSDDAIIGEDLKGNILSWNAGAQRMFGYTSEEMLGQAIMGIVSPSRREQERQILDGAKGGEIQHLETVMLHKDSQPLDVSLTISPIRDARGEIIGTSSIARDITERRRGEDARRRLAAIVESSEDAIISMSLRGIVTSWNQAAERLYGYTAEEATGKPVTILLPPDRRDEERSILERVCRGESVERYETVRQRKDGSRVEVSLTVSALRGADGKVIGASKITHDITERRRSQAALERQAAMLREQTLMLDLANVLARDLDDRVILWNSGMEKMYGWTKREALGQVAHELLRTEYPQPPESIRAVLAREGHWEGEVVHRHKDGRLMFVTSQWVLHRDDRGRPSAILEINNDITERKLAEEEVRLMNAELEERVRERTAELSTANKELEAFTYSVAHDLRAPLRHIDAFARILDEDFANLLPQEGLRYLDNIRRGSRNMSLLVDDLLNLARLGRQELKRQPTPLGGVVADALAELKRETEGRSIEVRVQALPTVECDSGLMRLVFINLLSNAIKYTRPRNEAVIEVGCLKTNDKNAVFVRDNGVGFSMKYADKLFGVFQRLHRSEEFEGTGVGLATVERIVRKHGGKVWAQSTEGQGATFYFTLAGMEKEMLMNPKSE